MNTQSLPTFLSTGAASLALVLGAWLFFSNDTNIHLQGELQRRQDQIQTRQQAVQLQQQQLQAQQQQIESGAQISQQVGPAVLRDLAALQVQNKNARIATLLKKYGIEVKPNSTNAAP